MERTETIGVIRTDRIVWFAAHVRPAVIGLFTLGFISRVLIESIGNDFRLT